MNHDIGMIRIKEWVSSRRIYRGISILALLNVIVVLGACGGLNSGYLNPVGGIARLDNCLKKYGVRHPEHVEKPSEEELTLSLLIGLRGMSVPIGVTREQFQAALDECGAGNLAVAPAPVTNPILQERVVTLRACMERNGYQLPPPNFPGPGPVIDTSGINIMSARWRATAKGCGIDRQLTPAALVACVGKDGLEGEAQHNTEFEIHILGLRRCLRHLR
jgi:hypothetical protein